MMIFAWSLLVPAAALPMLSSNAHATMALTSDVALAKMATARAKNAIAAAEAATAACAAAAAQSPAALSASARKALVLRSFSAHTRLNDLADALVPDEDNDNLSDDDATSSSTTASTTDSECTSECTCESASATTTTTARVYASHSEIEVEMDLEPEQEPETVTVTVFAEDEDAAGILDLSSPADRGALTKRHEASGLVPFDTVSRLVDWLRLMHGGRDFLLGNDSAIVFVAADALEWCENDAERACAHLETFWLPRYGMFEMVLRVLGPERCERERDALLTYYAEELAFSVAWAV